MIIDTDVIIWYMRGNQKAYEALENLNGFYISVISYMELVQGMRNNRELIELRRAMRNWNCTILQITNEISAKAMFYVEKHYLSHALQMADALIATTALVNAMPVMTGNDKHFMVIKELRMSIFSPT
jgi:predicted nucleic acid-binding protein